MHTSAVAIATAVLVTLVSGCTRDESDVSTEQESSQAPTPRSGAGPVVDSEACAEVRSGIDAFNDGRFDETVEHFQKALPLAEEQDDGSVPAGQLVEAVRYYAELEPDRYSEAARSSPDFLKYKNITLGQCVADDEGTPDSPGTNV